MVAAMVVAAGLGLSGCAPAHVGFVPLASHTLKVSAEQEADVVWIIRVDSDGGGLGKETVLRCNNSDQGPTCRPARVSQ